MTLKHLNFSYRAKEPSSPVERLHQSIARTIGTEIVSGKLQTGQQLGGEIENSANLGVSRTAYREALRLLISKGLVESRPKAGSKVRSRQHWNILDPDILQWMFESKPDPQFVKDIFELRSFLEPEAARLASIRRDSNDIEQMNSALEGMAKYGLATEKGRKCDRNFHAAVITASKNEALRALSSSIEAAVFWTTQFKQAKLSHHRDPMPDHIAVRDAIIASDAMAAKEAMIHLIEMSEYEWPEQ